MKLKEAFVTEWKVYKGTTHAQILFLFKEKPMGFTINKGMTKIDLAQELRQAANLLEERTDG